MMDQINITRLQESLYDFYHLYNLSFALSIVICPASEHSQANKCDNDGIDGSLHNELEENNNNVLFTFIDLFTFLFENGNNSSSSEHRKGCHKTDCISVLDVDLNKRFSTYFEVCAVLTLICIVLWFLSYVIKFIRRKLLSSNVNKQEYIPNDDDKESKSKDLMYSDIPNVKNVLEMGDIEPIKISFPFEHINGIVKGNVDQIFDSTLLLFLKQLDSLLGFEVQQFIDERIPKPPQSTSVVSSTSNDTFLQSPRVRKKWNRPQDITPSILRNNYTNEKNLRNWMCFDTICKRLNWLQPRCLQNTFHLERGKDKDENLNILVNFLRQHCLTKSVDWNVSVLIVNYSLFLLDQMFKHSNEKDNSDEVLRLIAFEGMGSAADGTAVGKPDHFDVMFVFEFNQSTDLNVLHNNYCDDISPGYVVLNVNNVDNKHSLKTNNCLFKAQIRDKFGFYLLVNQIEDLVDGMLRKVVRKLNTSHKYKMERLPFKLSIGSNRKLELIIDSSLLNGMGVELFNISVTFTPAICIESSKCSFLPKLYAVPTSRLDHRKHWEEKDKRIGALSKLFPRSNSIRIPSNLLWNISVAKLETDIRRSNTDHFCKANIESCHEECLMILKGLFSRNSDTSLSKGEIAPSVLNTVVSFLLMESSNSAWKMSQLRNRVSDAVHFLKSAYNNVFLPNFVIHNPHLIKKIPVLSSYSALLTGRQQNLLADMDAKVAQRTVTFIDSRLKEMGMSEIINEEYSDEMWEYEFFLFG